MVVVLKNSLHNSEFEKRCCSMLLQSKDLLSVLSEGNTCNFLRLADQILNCVPKASEAEEQKFLQVCIFAFFIYLL